MSEIFQPGQVLRTLPTRDGRTAIFRYPQADDTAAMQHYINRLSAENTFILFSGEQVTLEEEQAFLDSVLEQMVQHQRVMVHCWVDDELAGLCSIETITSEKERSKHVGLFGISLAEPYRGLGLSQPLAQAAIDQTIPWMPHIRMIYLKCFATNTPALKMYSKVGFREVGRVPGMLFFRGEYIDEVQMVLPIDRAK